MERETKVDGRDYRENHHHHRHHHFASSSSSHERGENKCMSSPVRRRTSSIPAVLLLPGKHFPSISPSIARSTLSLLLFQWQYLESFRCLICSKMPFFFWYTSLLPNPVFRSVQMVLSIQRNTYISKAVPSFSSHFSSAQLSDRIMRYCTSVIVQVVSSGPCRRLLLSNSLSAVE